MLLIVTTILIFDYLSDDKVGMGYLDYCVAQTDSLPGGRGGGSEFPGLMTRGGCEETCEPIHEQVIEEGVWGYCRFGDTDHIWQEKMEHQAESAQEALEEIDARFRDATHQYECRVFIDSGTDTHPQEIAWQHISDRSECARLCQTYEQQATQLNLTANCYWGDDELWQYEHVE